MTTLSQQIKDILNDEFNNINEKIKGTAYLENLKYKILDQITSKIDKSTLENYSESNSEFEFENNNKKINIKILRFVSPKINLNNHLDKNLLLICLNQNIKIDLIDIITKKNFNINLIPYTGITLSAETKLSINYTKNSLLLKITCDEKYNEVEK